jgi:hypothetical protein
MTVPALITGIPAMLQKARDNARRLEDFSAENWEQIPFKVEHFLHAGMYCRTLTMPADSILTGAHIKIPTIVIISGNCLVYRGDDFVNLIGYHALAASADRKQVFVAAEQTTITMLFATDANDVKKAEEEFTDEWSRLTTRTKEV